MTKSSNYSDKEDMSKEIASRKTSQNNIRLQKEISKWFKQTPRKKSLRQLHKPEPSKNKLKLRPTSQNNLLMEIPL